MEGDFFNPQHSSLIVSASAALGILLLVTGFTGCAGGPRVASYSPGYPIGYEERGRASWYGPGFHGNRTASGERFDMYELTAAHRTLPFGSVVRVRALSTGQQVTVRVNDRGPFSKGRILDLSLAAAKALGMTGNGTEHVELKVVGYQGRLDGVGVLRVQVASFAERANALALVEKLKGRYSDVRIVAIELPSGKRYRVQVGRFSSEQQAAAVMEKLDAELNVESMVIRDDG
ncbi:MAG: septal ring lytic transglycosylase RlpA family lipoprotein [Nitrospiraceae bacterium]